MYYEVRPDSIRSTLKIQITYNALRLSHALVFNGKELQIRDKLFNSTSKS